MPTTGDEIRRGTTKTPNTERNKAADKTQSGHTEGKKLSHEREPGWEGCFVLCSLPLGWWQCPGSLWLMVWETACSVYWTRGEAVWAFLLLSLCFGGAAGEVFMLCWYVSSTL